MSEKILVVDDEEANIRMLLSWLIPCGYDIGTACNGREAVQKARDCIRFSEPCEILLSRQ